MSQWCRTGTGFVGINATGAPADSQHNRAACKATSSSRAGKSIFKNHGKCLRNHAGIDNHDENSADDVDNRHEWNDEIGEIGNTLETTQKNGCHEDRNGDADDIRIDSKGCINGIGYFCCLDRRSKHHACRHDDSPDDGQPAPVLAKAVLDIPGETTVPDAAYRVFFTIGQTQSNFPRT